MFPARDMKRCYLEKKKIAQLFWIQKALIYELRCNFSAYEKNTLTSIFN